MNVVIEKQYLLHEGGTKFYQAMLVRVAQGGSELREGATVTITHWGAQKDMPGPVTIMSCGQMKVGGGDTYQEVIRGKKSRGYKAEKVAWGTTRNFKNQAELDAHLIMELGAVEADNVKRMLGGIARSATSAEAFVPHKPVAEAVAAAAGTDGWGEF